MRYIATYLDPCDRICKVAVTADTEAEAVTLAERVAIALGGLLQVGLVAG